MTTEKNDIRDGEKMSFLGGKHKDGKKKTSHGFETEQFDSQTHYPVIRSSICTGEKVAGFREKGSGRFIEVALIRSQKDIEDFKEKYHVDSLKTEY